jgi:hypothetical protein
MKAILVCRVPAMLRHLRLVALVVAGLPGFAQAAEPDPARIERLVRQLGSDQFRERQAAMQALDAAGEAALPALRKAENDSDPEVRRRAGRIREVILARLRAQAVAHVERLGGSVAKVPDEPGSGVSVTLTGNDVRESDVARLRWLDDLEGLDLSGTGVTDAVLARLSLRGLKQLDLSATRVTDAGLAHIRQCQGLKYLNLEGTTVSDAGLAHLGRLKNLCSLWLAGTKVTDAGLGHLAGLSGLCRLDLAGTTVTDAGLADLQKKLPRLQVTR